MSSTDVVSQLLYAHFHLRAHQNTVQNLTFQKGCTHEGCALQKSTRVTKKEEALVIVFYFSTCRHRALVTGDGGH